MTELAIVLFVTLLVFGATKVPALGDALGRAVRSLRREARGADAAGAGSATREPPARRP
jgi:sec-independent protein translocase protein TatA